MTFTKKNIKNKLSFKERDLIAKLIAFILIMLIFQVFDNSTFCFRGIAGAGQHTAPIPQPIPTFNFDVFRRSILEVSPYITQHYLTPPVVDILKPRYMSGNTNNFNDLLFAIEYLIDLKFDEPHRGIEWLSEKLNYFLTSELDYAPIREHSAIRAKQPTADECKILVEEIHSNYREHIE